MHTRRDFFRRSVGMGLAAGLAGGVALPGRSYGAVGGGHSGNLGAVTAQLWGTGLFIGNEFQGWSDATRQNVFATVAGWGFNFVCPKGMPAATRSTWYSIRRPAPELEELGPRQGAGVRPVYLLRPEFLRPRRPDLLGAGQ